MADSDSSLVVGIASVFDPAGVEEANAGLDDLQAKSAETSASMAADSAATSEAAAAGAAGVAGAASKSSSSLENLSNNLESAGKTMKAAGDDLTKYVTVPVVGIAAASVDMAMKFQQTMELLTTQAGTPQKAIAGLSAAVLNLAPQVGAGPDALATALYHIASVGNGIWSTAQQLNTLKIAAEGAKIGQADLNDTTYALTSALSSNITGAQGAAQMMSVLNAIVGSGDMHMQDLNGAIGTGFLGAAQAFGISIQSVGTALATLTDNGESAQASATRLRMMWALMASPSKEAAGILGDLGLTTSEVSTATGTMNQVFAETGLTTTTLADDLRQPNGVLVAIQDLKSHLETAGLSASQTDAVLAKAFGGGRTDAALLTLLGNTDRMQTKFDLINQDTTKFNQDWQEQQATNKQKFDEAWGGIQSDLIKLGDTIMPEVTVAFTHISNAVSDLTNWFEHLSSGQKQFVINSLAIAAVAGPTLVVFGTLAKSLSNMIDLARLFGTGISKLPGIATGAFNIVSGAISGTSSAMTALNGVMDGGGVAALGVYGLAAAGAAADILLIYNAIKTVEGAFQAWNNTLNANISNGNSESAAMQQILSLEKSGTPAQQARAKSAMQVLASGTPPGFASGVMNFQGGYALVGEDGPELLYLPQGSNVLPQTAGGSFSTNAPGSYPQSTTNNKTTVTIGTVVLNSAAAVSQFFTQLDQDTISVGKGLTASRGLS